MRGGAPSPRWWRSTRPSWCCATRWPAFPGWRRRSSSARSRGDARPDSDVDLFVYGDHIPDRALGKALLDASVVLDRPVDAKRYDARTFRRDAHPGASFLPAVLQGPQLWLAGSPADLPDTRRAAA